MIWGYHYFRKHPYRDQSFTKMLQYTFQKFLILDAQMVHENLCVLLLNVHHQNQKIFTDVGPPLQKHLKEVEPFQPTNPIRIPIQVPTKSPTFPTWALHFPNFSDELPQVTTVPSILIHAKALTEDWIC